MDPAIAVDKPETEVVTAGDGKPGSAGKKAMFNIFLAHGNDGKKAVQQQRPGHPDAGRDAENQFFQVIIDGLVGKPQGSRVAIAATVEDVWGAGVPQLELKTTDTVLFVLDILSVEPTRRGRPVRQERDPPATAPVVEESGGKVTGLDFDGRRRRPRRTLQVIPLVEGDRPGGQGRPPGDLQLLSARSGARTKAFDSSFTRGAPAPFGVGVKGPHPGVGQGSPGPEAGSRVLIIAPPAGGRTAPARSQASPTNSTLAFVVDVLGVDSDPSPALR